MFVVQDMARSRRKVAGRPGGTGTAQPCAVRLANTAAVAFRSISITDPQSLAGLSLQGVLRPSTTHSCRTTCTTAMLLSRRH